MNLSVEGKAFVNNTFQECCLGIENGKIVAIKKTLKAEKHLTFPHRIILPAGIDIHVHFREPGMTEKEDFSSGSLAAVFGGITCVFDMPNTIPAVTNLTRLKEKIMLTTRKSYVDFGLYAAVTNLNIQQLHEIAPYCNGFKIFLADTTCSLSLSTNKLHQALEHLQSLDKLTLFHAEDNECLTMNKRRQKNCKDHALSRPSFCEEKAIMNILSAAQHASFPLHICHLSSIDGMALLKNHPDHVSVGVTPHHLLFDNDSIPVKNPFFKVNPPIRSSFDRQALWEGVQNGHIDLLESDHAPHTLEEKEQDFDDAPCGLPGVETMLPLFLVKVKREELSFARLISLICERPAKLINIPKGYLKIGNDADFIIVNMKDIRSISSEKLHSKFEWTPYEGHSAIFPSDVFLRGERIITEGECVGYQGYGHKV